MAEYFNKGFEAENDEILSYILDSCFFNKFREKDIEFQEKKIMYVELFLTSVCNQKCSYCYLYKYQDELYPPEIRDVDTILANLKSLLQFFIDEDMAINRIDLFSGEIWGMTFGNKVFDILLEYLDKGLKLNQIMIPSNMSFLINGKVEKLIQTYIHKFRKKNLKLNFSASFDGKFLDGETRPYKKDEENSLKTSEKFYETLFAFCKKNGYGFHPMVGAHGIGKWKENFKWFYEMYEKHTMSFQNAIMLLEVRNDNWQEDTISKYLEFLNYEIDFLFERMFNNDKESFAKGILSHKHRLFSNYNNISINPTDIHYPACTIHKSLCVRLGDLAICPCHRTSYDKFLYGHFRTKDSKIVGVKAKNIQLANRLLLCNSSFDPKCSGCRYQPFCMGGCFGSQYEANNEIFAPCLSVCELFKQKANFLIYKYSKMGILDAAINNEKDAFHFNTIVSGKEYKEWLKNFQKKELNK